MNQASKSHIIGLLNKGTRLDGRGLLEYRKPISVNLNISKSAEGSAKVEIGGTVVLAGVKMEVSKPYPDSPDQGGLMVNTELIPLSNPEFESGPPGIQAIELSRVVDRGIRESKAIDNKKLCIEVGEKAWTVIVDIIPLNDEGNLFDASSLAALAALKNVKFPKLNEDGSVDYKEKTEESLPLNKEPVSVTICKIGDHLIVDPLTEEELVIDARLTVATDEKEEIVAMQKGGEVPLSEEDIAKMIEIGIEKCNELRKALK